MAPKGAKTHRPPAVASSLVRLAPWAVLSPSSAPASFPSPGQQEGWLLPHYSLTPPVLAGGQDKVLMRPPRPCGCCFPPHCIPEQELLVPNPSPRDGSRS